MNVRKATPKDLATVQQLNAALFAHDAEWISHLNHDWPDQDGKSYFEKMIAGDGGICLVVESEGEVCGYLAGSVKKPESYRKLRLTGLDNMFVKADQRHKGAGRALINAFMDWSRQQDAEKISVSASVPNATAIEFYEAAGFEPYSLELEISLQDGATA